MSTGPGDRQDISGFEDLFDQLLENSEGDELAIRDVIDAFGYQAFGPLILVPALLAVLPTGAIPTVPTLLGLLIVLVSGQMLIGKNRPWIPKRLRDTSVDRMVLKEAFGRFRPAIKGVDRIIKPRLTVLVDPPMLYGVAVLVVLLAMAMVPLEVIPFAVALPGSSILALGLGLSTRDGLAVLLGLALSAPTVALLVWLF
ncbi:MAG: exopolysaccharide biosynthesis protein [Alphaproteobacteria bacterium]